jgi:hypothetical protein
MGKYGADIETKTIELSGTTFVIQRFDWGLPGQPVYEFHVWEPGVSWTSHHTVTAGGGWGEKWPELKGGLWGRIDAYFPDEKFAYLKSYSEERRANVAVFRKFRQDIADYIAGVAWGVQVKDGKPV